MTKQTKNSKIQEILKKIKGVDSREKNAKLQRAESREQRAEDIHKLIYRST